MVASHVVARGIPNTANVSFRNTLHRKASVYDNLTRSDLAGVLEPSYIHVRNVYFNHSNENCLKLLIFATFIIH